MAPRKKINYVNNPEFLREIIKYKAKIKEHKELGLEPPRMTNYLGECISQIANRLAYRPNFINYTYREDMIYDGLENAIMAFNNFDPEKYQNPFAYFTQVIWFAFLRRIEKEQKQTYVKYKMQQNSMLYNESFTQSGTSLDKESGSFIEINNDHVAIFIEKYEAKLAAKKLKKNEKLADVVKFIEAEPEETLAEQEVSANE